MVVVVVEAVKPEAAFVATLERSGCRMVARERGVDRADIIPQTRPSLRPADGATYPLYCQVFFGGGRNFASLIHQSIW